MLNETISHEISPLEEKIDQLFRITEQKTQEIGQLKDTISLMTEQIQNLQEQNASLEERINQLETHHDEFETRILANNIFPLTRVFLTMNGYDQPGIASYKSNDYISPESVINFVPSSLSGDLRWDDVNHRLYVGSAGQYLVTGRVAIQNMCLKTNMNLLVVHNDGASDYRVSRKSCETGSLYTNYVPVHYTFRMNNNDYLSFYCNVTNNNITGTCTICGTSTVYTMIEVTRIA